MFSSSSFVVALPARTHSVQSKANRIQQFATSLTATGTHISDGITEHLPFHTDLLNSQQLVDKAIIAVMRKVLSKLQVKNTSKNKIVNSAAVLFSLIF